MKLVMEQLVAELAEATGARGVLGRISTLYGPGQRIDKPQGFVAHLCKSFLTRRPMTIYVPLDTMRDYIYADDAAEVIVAAMARVIAGDYAGQAVTKNIASHVPTTLGHVLHESTLVFKHRPDIILTASAMARGQVHDLRIESTTWPELNDIPRRSLLVGLAQTRASMELASPARIDPS
jgi:UDP-glucose 4-epimerase